MWAFKKLCRREGQKMGTGTVGKFFRTRHELAEGIHSHRRSHCPKGANIGSGRTKVSAITVVCGPPKGNSIYHRRTVDLFIKIVWEKRGKWEGEL